MSKPRKAAKRLTPAEANRRLVSIVSFLEPEVRVALEMKAVLQSWSAEAERQTPDERRFYNAPMINFAGDVIAHQLAITLARLFDQGSKRFHDNRKDIASIPLALRLLRQKRCKKCLVARRHDWFKDAPSLAQRFPVSCGEAIERAIAAYYGRATKKPYASALRRLHKHRNSTLAHNLFDANGRGRPYYGDLYVLTDWATLVMGDTIYAVTSARHNYATYEETWKIQARRLYRAASRRNK
jgi:hypothetical protein